MKRMSLPWLAYADLTRINRPYGALLLLAPTLWSLTLAANGVPSLRLLLIFGLGTFIMRSAGCVINDIADREFDRHVERTQTRPLPSGRVSVAAAFGLFTALCLAAFVLALFLDRLTQTLSVVGLGLAVGYPFAKRYLPIPQLVLAAAFGWGAIMAWSAVRGVIEPPAILIFLANLAWATGYDTIYALMDRDDDARIGIGSSALLFGTRTWLAVALLFVLAGGFLCALGRTAGLGGWYYLSVALVGLAFAHQVQQLRRQPSRAQAFALFRSNVNVGWLLLAGILLTYHL